MAGPSRSRALTALTLLLLAVGLAVAPPATAARDVHRLACPAPQPTPFTDVAGTRHADAIACAVALGLTSGTTPTTFEPAAPVTRGQLATFLVRLIERAFAGVPVQDLIDLGDQFGPDGFDDDEGSVHEGAVNLLAALGIVSGTGPRTYEPDAHVSRAQVATVVWRVLERNGAVDPSTRGAASFDDVAGSPHVGAIEALAAAGVVDGVAPRTYAPSAAVDRGAMAAFLVRAADYGIETGVMLPRDATVAYAALEGDGDELGTGAVLLGASPEVACVGAVVGSDSVDVDIVGPDGDVVVSVAAADPTRPVPCRPAPGVGAVLADLEAHELRVRHGGGELRGALGTVVTGLVADLDAVQVVPGPGDGDVSGFAIGFTTTQPDVVCMGVLATDASFVPVRIESAHAHRGEPHANGPEIMAIEPLDDASGLGGGGFCQRVDGGSDLADDPTGFYVDVHTVAFPGGAARGQLEEDDQLVPIGAAGLRR